MSDLTLRVRGVAHDLNNQIMILMNSLDRMMVLWPDAPDARLALKAAEQCAELASQLLPQSRTRRASKELTVREMVGETAAVVRSLLPEGNRLIVDCRVDGLDSLPAELQHCLVNLCINSVDAMNGPGIIRIIAEQERGALRIIVEDTGPGVPDELKRRIFEPLFTTKSARGGHGLGLARVRGIVERLGGTIRVFDVFPHGASFRMTLPRAGNIPREIH